MRQNDEEKEMIDISQDLKNNGFVYRTPDKNDPRFKECEKMLSNSWEIKKE